MHPDTDLELAAWVVANWPADFDIGDMTLADLPGRTAAPIPPPAHDRVKTTDVNAGAVRLRVHTPADRTGPLPCVYWMHGGGMILGSPELCDERLQDYADRIGCVCVSPDYRMPPQDPYPAPVEDCYAGLLFVVEQAGELGVDAGRIVIGGDSAGGGLAAGVALLARERGGPDLLLQVLVSPMLDDRDRTESAELFARSPIWSRAANRLGWRALLGDRVGGPDVPAAAAPARIADLSGLPPAFIDVGGVEIFRDECLDFAQRLTRAGVPVEFHLYPGAFHGWHLATGTHLAEQATAAEFAAVQHALRGVAGYNK